MSFPVLAERKPLSVMSLCRNKARGNLVLIEILLLFTYKACSHAYEWHWDFRQNKVIEALLHLK